MNAEQWRWVPGYEGLYRVSDLGRVKRVPGGRGRTPGRLLSPGIRPSGHQHVQLWQDGRGHTIGIHILVLTAFVGPAPPGLVCRHLNGNPLDNRLTNLRWGTKSESVQDRIRNGTYNNWRHLWQPAKTR